MARSRTLLGPYELHPDVYILSARIVRTPRCSARAMPIWSRRRRARPTWSICAAGRCGNRGRCMLGRETAIQPMTWGEDGWLRTTDGRRHPDARRSPRPPALAPQPPPVAAIREDFDGRQLPIDFQWLRTPWPEELFSLSARPGYLRLYGRETIGSLFTQALVARRQQAHCFSASTVDGVRAAALPADGGTGLLLQQQPSSTISTSRATRAANTCASCRRCPIR